jgi:hypothetical protein
MKAGRITTLAVVAIVAAALTAPAHATPDPTTGVKGDDVPTVVVTPISDVAPEAAGGGFDWSDAAVGAAIALGVAGLSAWAVRSARPRAQEQPLADS